MRALLAIGADLLCLLAGPAAAQAPIDPAEAAAVFAAADAQYEFDPRSVTPLEPLGTVYPALTIRDAWGPLTVTRGGALMGSNWDFVAVHAGDNTPPRSDDWTLELKDGWALVPGPRPGDWAVERLAGK